MAKDASHINGYYDTDFRKNPQKYRIGHGEYGVLTDEPYKSEILLHWRFKSPEIACVVADKLESIDLRFPEVTEKQP